MLGWLRRRRETAERIDAQAEALMRRYAIRAYAEARRRECAAKTKVEAQNWSRVALMIAHKTGKRVGLDTSTRMASDAIFAYSHLEPSVSSPRAHNPELDPLDELGRFVSEDPRRRQYRIQFLGAETDHGSPILAEVEVLALDVSTAMREAARTPWPPGAIGFRLVDPGGRDALRG